MYSKLIFYLKTKMFSANYILDLLYSLILYYEDTFHESRVEYGYICSIIRTSYKLRTIYGVHLGIYIYNIQPMKIFNYILYMYDIYIY